MNFKKHISIFLALFILLVNSSASLVMHYCHDQIAYVSLVFQDKSSNEDSELHSCCVELKKVDEKKECCSDQEIKVEKKVDYTLLKDFQVKFTAVTFLPYQENVFQFADETYTNHEKLSYYCDSHAPPLCKLYSQLVFYA